MIAKEIVLSTVERWINNCENIGQLACCYQFINDTVYLRFGYDKEANVLLRMIKKKKRSIQLVMPDEEEKENPDEN